MSNASIVVLVAIAAAAAFWTTTHLVDARGPDASLWSAPHTDFGVVDPGEPQVRVVRTRNTSRRTLRFRAPEVSCRCLSVALGSSTVRANEEIEVRLRLLERRPKGHVEHSWWVVSESGLTLLGSVSALVAREPALDPPTLATSLESKWDREFLVTGRVLLPHELTAPAVTVVAQSPGLEVALADERSDEGDFASQKILVRGQVPIGVEHLSGVVQLMVATANNDYPLTLGLMAGERPVLDWLPRQVHLEFGRRRYSVPLPSNSVFSVGELEVFSDTATGVLVGLTETNDLSIEIESDRLPQDTSFFFALGQDVREARLVFEQSNLPRAD